MEATKDHKMVNLSLPAELIKEMKILSAKHGVSFPALIRQVLKKYIEVSNGTK